MNERNTPDKLSIRELIALVKNALGLKYSKPSTGIPKTDLASDVQTSLGKADTALQQHQSLTGYATETWVQNRGYQTAQDVQTAINAALSEIPFAETEAF